MSLELPLVLVTQKDYLESFQAGKVFMKNCLCYQDLENDDPQRGDKYDSAIKCGYEGYNLPDWVKNEVKNPRLMNPLTYIKCFFHYQRKDIKRTLDNKLLFQISEQSAQELKRFSEDYALFIFDVPEFIKRFCSACEKYHLHYYWGDVSYVSDDEYIEYEKKVINQMAVTNTEVISHFAFIKRTKYDLQQEFRLVVNFSTSQVFFKNEFTVHESIGFEMDKIDDISIIVKLSQLVDNPVVFEIDKRRLFFKNT